MPREASWSRSNSSWGISQFKRPNDILAASSGFDQRSMTISVSSRILEIAEGLPTTHAVFMVLPLPGTAPPSGPAFPRDQGLSPAPPIRAASRQQAASAPLQHDLRRFAKRVASLHMPTPAVSRRTCYL